MVIVAREHEILLTAQATIIGRHRSCHVCLGHQDVSRRHASVRLEAGGARIEDLGSTNGVFVNGQRIADSYMLEPGDYFVIADERFEVALETEAGRSTPARRPSHTTLKPPQIEAAGDTEDWEQRTRRTNAVAVAAEIAARALARGDFGQAEQVLSAHVHTLLEGARAGARLDWATTTSAIRSALDLAKATRRGGWVDCAVELATAVRYVLPSEVVVDLHRMMDAGTVVDPDRLRSYILALRAVNTGFASGERFAIGRLEGLERLSAAASRKSQR